MSQPHFGKPQNGGVFGESGGYKYINIINKKRWYIYNARARKRKKDKKKDKNKKK